MKDLKAYLIEKMKNNPDYDDDASAYQGIIEHIYMQLSRENKVAMDEIFELLTGVTLKEAIDETQGELVFEQDEESNDVVPMSYIP